MRETSVDEAIVLFAEMKCLRPSYYIWRAGPPGGVMGDGIVLSASVLKEWLAKQDESAQREAGQLFREYRSDGSICRLETHPDSKIL
jgi:hypothetical protein